VRSVRYFSQAQALASAKEVQPDQAQFYKLGDFPAFFTVKMASVDSDYPKLQQALAGTQGVDQVLTPIATIRKLLDLISSVRWFSVIVAIVVLVASVLLIANTIQVAAQQRRNETSIMRLVGASRWMTELPFMLETVIAAIVGGVIATGFIWLGKHFVMDNVLAGPTDAGTIPNLRINDVLVAGGLGLGVGIVLSAVTAFATLRLYVKV
jgi:cell division transport system permease protein